MFMQITDDIVRKCRAALISGETIEDVSIKYDQHSKVVEEIYEDLNNEEQQRREFNIVAANEAVKILARTDVSPVELRKLILVTALEITKQIQLNSIDIEAAKALKLSANALLDIQSIHNNGQNDDATDVSFLEILKD